VFDAILQLTRSLTWFDCRSFRDGLQLVSGLSDYGYIGP